jgi:hypothetical protein
MVGLWYWMNPRLHGMGRTELVEEAFYEGNSCFYMFLQLNCILWIFPSTESQNVQLAHSGIQRGYSKNHPVVHQSNSLWIGQINSHHIYCYIFNPIGHDITDYTLTYCIIGPDWSSIIMSTLGYSAQKPFLHVELLTRFYHWHQNRSIFTPALGRPVLEASSHLASGFIEP